MHQNDQNASLSTFGIDRSGHNYSYTSSPSRQSDMANWLLQQTCVARPAHPYSMHAESPGAFVDPRGLATAWDELSPSMQVSRSVSPLCPTSEATTSPIIPSATQARLQHTRAATASPSRDDDSGMHLPYNQLLYNCFMEMPGHEALLKDIYAWFERNTDKARNPGQKGWQNSIRHNLSMNEAFVRGSRLTPHDAPNNNWMLSDQAVQKGGVEPTTRFRNSPRHVARVRHSQDPYPLRHMSGHSKARVTTRRKACIQSARNWVSDSDSPSPRGFYESMSTRHSMPFDAERPFSGELTGAAAYPNESYSDGADPGICFEQGTTGAYSATTSAAFDSSRPVYPGTSVVPLSQSCLPSHNANCSSQQAAVPLTLKSGLDAMSGRGRNDGGQFEQCMSREECKSPGLSYTPGSHTPSLEEHCYNGTSPHVSASKSYEQDGSNSSVGVPKTPDQQAAESLFGSEFFNIGNTVEPYGGM